MRSKNVAIVEIEDGSTSDEKCFGDAVVLVLDWDQLEISTCDAREKMDELLGLGLPEHEIQPYLDKLQTIIDEEEDEEIDDDEEDDDAEEIDDEEDEEDEE